MSGRSGFWVVCYFYLVLPYYFPRLKILAKYSHAGLIIGWRTYGTGCLLTYLGCSQFAVGASLFSLSFARKRGEWTAMLANGISPWQCFFLVVLLGLGIGWSSDRLMKISGNRSMGQSDSSVRSLKMQIGSERLWYFRSFDPVTLSGNDLQLFYYGKQGEDFLKNSCRPGRLGPRKRMDLLPRQVSWFLFFSGASCNRSKWDWVGFGKKRECTGSRQSLPNKKSRS